MSPSLHLVRAAVSEGLDLVIAIGSPRGRPLPKRPMAWFNWGDKQKVGLLLQERARPARVYLLAAAPGFPDCTARIERATATDTVISCTGEKSTWRQHQKFVYDVRTKRLVSRFAYAAFAFYRAFSRAGGVVFVGSDAERLVAVEFQPGREPAFRVLGRGEARPWTERIRIAQGTIGVDHKPILYVQPDPFEPVRFGPSRAFALTQEQGNSLGPRLTIVEKHGDRTVEHALPRSDYDVFAKARPERVKDGYGREVTEIDERIGPWKLDGDKLWFGKTFYDGEGTTGVGGFGYFDTTERRYRLFAPPEVANWSVSAIYVEPGTVWMALVHNGEWGGSGGGLPRFDRRAETVRHVEIPDIGVEIGRVGDRLVIATDFGITIVEGGRTERYFVDRTADGRLRVAAATRQTGE